MAGIDFDRQVFVPPAEQAAKQPSRIMGVVILAIAIAGIGFIGYKLLSDASLNGTSADANSLQQIQQQLADMKERVDQLEKLRARQTRRCRHGGSVYGNIARGRQESLVPRSASAERALDARRLEKPAEFQGSIDGIPCRAPQRRQP